MLVFLFVFLLGSPAFASRTAQPEKLPLRVVFLGGDWSAGSWTQPQDTVAARFAHHLEKFLNQKIESRSIPVQNLRDLPSKAKDALEQKGADYLFYFCDHSRTPVELAAQYYSPWPVQDGGVWNYLGRQIGAIRLGNKINSSGYPESILLNPMGEILRRTSQIATYFGAKFIFLWPGFTIAPVSWEAPVPEGWPYKILSFLDVLKSKPRISSERLNYYFRTNSVVHVSNLQIGNYYSAIRESGDPNHQFSSKAVSDKVGEMLATSVVSQEF